MNMGKTCFLIIAICARAALGWDGRPDSRHAPAFFEQENGLFKVALLDGETREIVAYRGVFVEKSELPMPSILHCPATVYAIPGKRPEVVPREDPWKPIVEDMFTEKPPLWPVVEREPELKVRPLPDGRVAVGFRLLHEFYVLAEMDAADLPPDAAWQEEFSGANHPVAETAGREAVVGAWRRGTAGREDAEKGPGTCPR